MNGVALLPRSRIFRLIAFILLPFGSAVLGLVVLFNIVLPVLAWLTPGWEHFWYDAGAYGFYRTASYVTLPANVTVPKGQWGTWDNACDDGGLIMLAPFGPVIGRPGPIILDARGELVWASVDHYYASTTTNVNVQEYQGAHYLTFWAGDKHGGEGSGTAYMLDSQYKVHRTVNAVGPGLRTDLHDFFITDEGTALISTINDTRMDLTSLGWGRGNNGPIEDSVLQEIDIETGDLILQWRASDHFSVEDTHYWNPFGGYDLIDPFDFFHMNTAQKDSKGNILISARHLHKLLYLDGTTGEVIWTLGGKAEENDFTDLSNGKATDFTWQHHSHIQSEDHGIITMTVMDNAAAGVFSLHDKPTSHALMLRLDTANMTAELLHSYTLDRRSPSQGSVQVLPNDHVFVGWGPAAAWSEHAPAGDALCEYHFAASWYFTIQRVKNYRVFKVYDWHAAPDYPPVARTLGGRVYVSWNGATEVRYWALQGADDENGQYRDIETIAKAGFESSFELPNNPSYAFLRVAALDADRSVLHHSLPTEEAENAGSGVGTFFIVFFVLGMAIGVLIVYRMWTRKRRQESQRGAWEMLDWRGYKYQQVGKGDDDEERAGRGVSTGS